MAKRKPGNPNWIKGKSASPGGKPGKYRLMLDKAMIAESKKQKKTLIGHAVAEAFTDNTVLNAILKKILPDLKSIEAKLDTESPFRLILEYAPTGNKPKDNKKGKQRPISGTTVNDNGRLPLLDDADSHPRRAAVINTKGINKLAKGDKPKRFNVLDSGSGS